VIQRGIDRAACFFSDEDRQVYLETLGGLARSCGVAIPAYVLMTNHVHLLLTASTQPNLSALMKGLGQRYVQYVNRTYHRTGTLWEGGFLALGPTPPTRVTAYQALFTEVLDPAWVDSLRAYTHGGFCQEINL
jgi:REP element-mobilizing transposase RayT